MATTTKLKKDKKARANRIIKALDFNPCVNVYHPEKNDFYAKPIWTSVIDEMF